MQITKEELDLPQNQPEYAPYSAYPPKIRLTILHIPPARNESVQMETDLKLKVSGWKEEVHFCLPLPGILPTTGRSACQSSKH